jgi:hypothetical protein
MVHGIGQAAVGLAVADGPAVAEEAVGVDLVEEAVVVVALVAVGESTLGRLRI